jgi:Mg-chelatase subunit ChlI
MTHDDIMATASHYSEVDHTGYVRFTEDDLINFANAIIEARETSANVAQGAEAVATVKVYETYTGQNGWIEVTQEEYDRTKDKYEHRIRRVSAPPAQTALTDEQWLELRRIARTYNETGFPKHAREFFAALTAAQSASGDAK